MCWGLGSWVEGLGVQKWGHKDIVAKAAPSGNFSAWVTLSYPQPGVPATQAPLPSPLCVCVGGNSPLCSPFTAGFIDFIVEPTFSVLTDVAEKSVQPLADEDSKSKSQPR